MKKVLALACSPERGGNSDTLLDAFLSGVTHTQKISVEKIYLHATPIAPYSYKKKFPDVNEEPEFVALTEKLAEADALVIATPTYNFGVPAPLKNFIDRIGFMSLDYKKKNIFRQPTGLLGHLRVFCIVTGGTPNILEKLLFVVFPRFILWVEFLYYWAWKTAGKYAGSLSYSNPAKKRLDLLTKYEKYGQRFAKKIIGNEN